MKDLYFSSHCAALKTGLRALFLVLASAAGTIAAVRADDASARREDQLKAAYLFNFVKFVEWPGASLPDFLTVCFAGGDGVHEALAAGIESKQVGTRQLSVRQLRGSDPVTNCNVLYIEAAVRVPPHAPELPILTVSDAKAFAQNGGIIELFTDNNRLRFSINVDNAQRAGLRVSSSLLQLAASVEKDKK